MEPEPGIDESLLDKNRPAVKPCDSSGSTIFSGSTSGDANAPYRLEGPQIEFEAAYWLLNGQLRMPTIDEIRSKYSDLHGPIPAYPRDGATLKREINELKNLAGKRDNELPTGYLSDFINLQNPPFGAIINGDPSRAQYRVDFVKLQDSRITRIPKTLVLTGRELARMFENETPGLLHEHALKWFLYNRADISPPRHARIWASLNLTLYAALSAAWHYKWAEDRSISFRQRPWEYDPSISVLYDREVNDRGNGDGPLRGCPCPSPGTPRHPAYPSGHSTYSAAASHILKYFFRDQYSVQQLDKLADNVGEARLWAGVHWRSDHDFGQRLGVAVAEVIIDQLKQDCVPRVSTKTCEQRKNEAPPTTPALKRAQSARKNPCQNPNDHDRIPSRDEAPRENRVF